VASTYPFRQARHFRPNAGRAIDLVVVHTAEAPERGTTAEAVARWFSTTDREVSAHYCIDDDSIVQCVREQDIAWSAPGANENGIHLELAGYAAQTPAEWEDAYSQAMLRRAAGLTAGLCRRYGIPVAWLRAADLIARERGITGHADVSRAFRRTDHTDPGADFPVAQFLTLVRSALARGSQRPTLAAGAAGTAVGRLQRLLRAHGCLPRDAAVDGVFGPVTEQAVRTCQQRAGLDPDGVAGPATWEALLAPQPADVA